MMANISFFAYEYMSSMVWRWMDWTNYGALKGHGEKYEMGGKNIQTSQPARIHFREVYFDNRILGGTAG